MRQCWGFQGPSSRRRRDTTFRARRRKFFETGHQCLVAIFRSSHPRQCLLGYVGTEVLEDDLPDHFLQPSLGNHPQIKTVPALSAKLGPQTAIKGPGALSPSAAIQADQPRPISAVFCSALLCRPESSPIPSTSGAFSPSLGGGSSPASSLRSAALSTSRAAHSGWRVDLASLQASPLPGR
jgi:hypothetical protein